MVQRDFFFYCWKKKWSKKIFSNIAWPSTKRIRLCVWIQVWCCEQFLFHGQFWCQGWILLFAFAVIIIHFIYNNFKTCIWNREANNVIRKVFFFSKNCSLVLFNWTYISIYIFSLIRNCIHQHKNMWIWIIKKNRQ